MYPTVLSYFGLGMAYGFCPQTAPPSSRVYGLRYNRKLSSCGTQSPPRINIAGIYNGYARSKRYPCLDAKSYGQQKLVG